MAEPDWWRTFFDGLAVDLWLRVPTPEQTRAEADFLESQLGLAPGARVLDVPCGGGRHAVALAGRGYDVTGVDLSPRFLEAARELAGARSAAVTWEHREMRDLPWDSAFDGAYCLGNGFAYLDDDGNAAFVAAVARALRPGGRFVLETGVVAESILPNLHDRLWYEFGDVLFLIHNRYDHARGRLETGITLIRGDRVERSPISQRVYTYRELGRIFEAAGFGEIEVFASLAGEPYRLGSPNLYLTATRG